VKRSFTSPPPTANWYASASESHSSHSSLTATAAFVGVNVLAEPSTSRTWIEIAIVRQSVQLD
jgi:hypothetical protein